MTYKEQLDQITKVSEYHEKEARRAVQLFIDGYITYSELGQLLDNLHKSEVNEITNINKNA